MNLLQVLKYWWNDELYHVEFPTIPVVGTPFHFREVITEIKDLMIIGGRADAQDPMMLRVSTEFFSDQNHWYYREWLKAQKLDGIYDRKYFDCDDFGILYWAWVRVLYAQQRLEGVPFLGYAKSSAIDHAFNFAVTEKGIVFIEPQTGKIMANPGGIYWMQF